MAEYLTTKEVAAYLRLNQKKVYLLVSQGQLPAARVSGKWLFPKHLVDQWVEQNTVYPTTGVMGAVLEEMVVVQGSDDWLFGSTAAHYREERGVPVVSAQVGSLAGLTAVSGGRAHLAGCHVENAQVMQATAGQGCYLVTLFERRQGLILDRDRHPEIGGLADVSGSMLRFAQRQPLSGTYRLAQRLLDQEAVDTAGFEPIGPFSSHLELALSIARGEADFGLGTQLAAELCGLDFVELDTEPYKLAVPLQLMAHPRVAGFLEFVMGDLQGAAARGVSGYSFRQMGRMETVVAPDVGGGAGKEATGS
jgi:putative molybdopterin biosynthesis protein